MARTPASALVNNPLATAWGHALRIMRGNEQSGKIAAMLDVSISFVRLLEIAATKMSSNKTLKLISAFPQLEFQPLSKFLTVLNITSSATNTYVEYILALNEIREANKEDDYNLDTLLEKLSVIVNKEETLDRQVLEPILSRERFAEDIIKYVSTRTLRSSELQGIPDEEAQRTKIFDEYDSAFHNMVNDTHAIYINSFSKLVTSVRHINPNMFVNETNKWEDENGNDFVSVIGIFRNFSWMLEPENTTKFPLKYILNKQFKELKYIILENEGTSTEWEKKFKNNLLQRWRYDIKERAADDYISECLAKITIEKSTTDTPYINEFLTTTPDRINELVWVFTTVEGNKIGFSILPRDKQQNIAYGEALSYGVSKQKFALFKKIWESLK